MMMGVARRLSIMVEEGSRSTTPDLRVVLWSHQRSLSTCFERSIRQLKGVKVIHEPHRLAFFCGPGRPQFAQVPCNPFRPEATLKAADDEICQDYPGYHSVFIKDHAYFVKGNYHQYIEGRFSNSFKHTFLIRNPVKALSSMYKVQKGAGFPTNAEIIGIQELYELYETVKAVDSNPIVIDSDDLLADPKGMMQLYCEGTGLPFNECMLTWNPMDEVPEEWKDMSQYFHASAINSSGFNKPYPCDEAALLCELPIEFQEAVKKSQPFYNALHSHRIMPQ